MITTPAKCLTATSWQAPSLNHPVKPSMDYWSSETPGDKNICGFKVSFEGHLLRRKSIFKNINDILLANGEWCWTRDFRRRFSFGTRDQAWSLKRFCVAVILKWTRDRERFWYRHQKGAESAPLTSLSKGAVYFFKLIITINQKNASML